MPKKLPQTISEAEWDRLADQPSRSAPTGIRNLAVLHAMYYAGLRVSEVCNLSPRDLNAKKQTLRVREGKGGRDRANLGVPAPTWAIFERWAARRPSSRYFFSTLDGNRMSERYVQQMVARYARRANVLKPTREGERAINPHMLRHSYATRLIEAGVPVHDVAAALGHSSLTTTQRYLHVNDSQLADRLREALSTDPESSDLERMVRRVIRDQIDAWRQEQATVGA